MVRRPVRRFVHAGRAGPRTDHEPEVRGDALYSDEDAWSWEFRLEDAVGGTRLSVTESGFDRIPADRREKAFRMNEGGWAAQVKNIERHVSS